jgi:hypothetical protein
MTDIPTTTRSGGDGTGDTASAVNVRPPHRAARWAVLACILVLTIFLASIGILYYQWFHHDNPTGLIVVEGDASLDEAVVIISQYQAPAAQAVPVLRAPLSSGGADHRLRLHLPPGHYTVAVEIGGRRLPLKPDEVDVEPRQPLYVSLTRLTASRP